MTSPSRKLIGYWLLLGVFMIMIQVLLGGITRLTGSGLSITEWNVIMGSIPPMNANEWQQAFDQYKQFPQYKLMNSEMTVDGFKSIFWWEFLHRLWARLMGFAFVIPFVYFLIRKMIDLKLAKKLLIIFVLGGMQGLLGWIMVQSGLIDKPWVNPINLSAHLVLALLLYGYLLWVALELLQPEQEEGNILSMKNFSSVLLLLIFIQIFYGGLMAGNKAALFYPTFPKIGAGYIPHGIFILQPWPLNLIENIGMIQVVHRSLGFIVAFCIYYFYWKGRNHSTTPYFKNLLISLPLLVTLQVILGIATLLNSLGKIPLTYGVLHQFVALLLLTAMILVHFQLNRKSREPIAIISPHEKTAGATTQKV
ncbi:MAG: COX15/CtaA family protein [Chitinophagales bacterium]